MARVVSASTARRRGRKSVSPSPSITIKPSAAINMTHQYTVQNSAHIRPTAV